MTETPTAHEVASSGVSRRTVIRAAAAGTTLAALGAISLDAVLAPAALGLSPLQAAVAEAMSFDTLDVAETSAAMVDPVWIGNQPGAWCAWLASYLIRANGAGRRTSSADLYAQFPQYSTPAVGDIIYYKKTGVTGGHTGFVVGVSGGVAQTIEGNTPGNPTVTKFYSQPWNTSAVVGYARPNWGTTYMEDDEEMKPIYISYSGATTTLANGFVLTANTMWIRETPTAPLTFIAPDQVVDHWNLYGIGANSPQFVYHDLVWFKKAFANDALLISKTAAAHA